MTTSRTVVLTGASAGIGRAAAILFARRGYRVALLARSPEGLAGACDDVRAAGGIALPIITDVADHAQVEAAAARVEQEFGAIDVWVNNAMATIFCPLKDMSPEDFERATRVTYLGAVWGTMAALKRMTSRNRGTIVQVGSALAYRSIPLQAPYCGAKSALRGFTDSVRSELIHDKSQVRITMVQLSAFNTPQFDWGRTCFDKQPQPVPPIFQPELAAQAILLAAERPRREFWIGFPAVKAILGTRVVPGFLDHLLAKRAYSGQFTDQPLPPGRTDNLYHPAPGDRGAHGRFDDQAKPSSLQFRLAAHRNAVVAAVLIVLVLLGAALIAM
ncbi:MAG TPA: SDR family oxidoreductase [Noviherbaspirillum sp.]|jgi:NAD(P)-dependent dehydrogenase (short-subunit alcohol dehydrogenase family)|uniref:SDR family oxidoreductase n=1 Tax=Noviherbaspirillum sp. TaxID=1926288 RepID=UPI002DDD1CE7|nr:SDR family oxidoreductase [Noviherbaspirillum sp.]HEV2609827.1 SDR family oxidoreductase [Noviherbaspirillum sp.]